MRNSAENKPFRIARYCSCPTFLHSREQGKVAACDIGRVAFAPRPRSPPLPIARKKEQVARTRTNRWDGEEESLSCLLSDIDFFVAKQADFRAEEKIVPSPFIHPAFVFLSFRSPAAFPSPLFLFDTVPFPANWTTVTTGIKRARIRFLHRQETFHNSVA